MNKSAAAPSFTAFLDLTFFLITIIFKNQIPITMQSSQGFVSFWSRSSDLSLFVSHFIV